jgi:DNA polymerase delta subunit 1
MWLQIPGRLTAFMPAVGIIEQGLSLPWLGNTILRGITYESNVPYALRYMIDTSIVGGNWVELPAGSYTLTPSASQTTHCQLEAHVRFDAVVSHPCEGEWSKLAPFRILSLDIECQGRKVR